MRLAGLSRAEPAAISGTVDAELIARVPRSVAHRLAAVPLRAQDGECLVGMQDAHDIFAQDELAALLEMPVRPVPMDADELRAMLERWYRRTDEIRKIAAVLQRELELRRQNIGPTTGLEAEVGDDAPVMRLLQNIFADAIESNASDIHLEPEARGFRIRQRVDGLLQEQRVDQANIFNALVIRLKLMAEIDITEKRLPQEGRFVMALGADEIEVRLATMPTPQGEAVVMRLLSRIGQARALDMLGFTPAQLDRIRAVLGDPHGMVLVVGPTGCGKSTTLNAMLGTLDTAERKLFTVEDPIECQLSRATQVQVNPRIGLGYADVLRSALRHDPDVIMVGEMRDAETADMAIRAALTGHMVLSTMHCNSARAPIPRLLDMGVEGYLLPGALRLVLAQRLLRRNCPHCVKPAKLSRVQSAWVAALEVPPLKNYRRGAGCNHCAGSGLRGRVGVYELLDMSTAMIDDALAQPGNRRRGADVPTDGLVLSALQLAGDGQTTIEEVQRVLGSSI